MRYDETMFADQVPSVAEHLFVLSECWRTTFGRHTCKNPGMSTLSRITIAVVIATSMFVSVACSSSDSGGSNTTTTAAKTSTTKPQTQKQKQEQKQKQKTVAYCKAYVPVKGKGSLDTRSSTVKTLALVKPVAAAAPAPIKADAAYILGVITKLAATPDDATFKAMKSSSLAAPAAKKAYARLSYFNAKNCK